MNNRSPEFINHLLQLPPLRGGGEWWEKESTSLICLETLFNQRVGVERATAAAMAIHDYFRRPFHESARRIRDVTGFPYIGVPMRGPAKSLLKHIRSFLAVNEEATLSEAPSSVIGALASLERYYNRTNTLFDALRIQELSPDDIESLTAEIVIQHSQVNLPVQNVRQQLRAAATVLRMKQGDSAELSVGALRETLLKLPRVGTETADTLLLFVFGRPVLIIDDYLKRVAFRHYLLDKTIVTPRGVRQQLSPLITTMEDAAKLHARFDDLAVLYCLARSPRCEQCPLKSFNHRE
jgi:endonuclease III